MEKPLIVLRFSAMGDVAMVASVLGAFCHAHPSTPIIMVSRAFFKPFFDHLPQVHFHPIETKGRHGGLKGLFALFKELMAYRPLAIADLHDNIRSRILSAFFRSKGIRIRRIDKGRLEKKALTREKNKIKKQLKPTVERYAEVLYALGYPFVLNHRLQPQKRPLPNTARRYFGNEQGKKIGIAPFAQHEAKIYPAHLMQQVIDQLLVLGHSIILFGGGKAEEQRAQAWQQNRKRVFNTIGQFNLTQELDVISHLDLMISMDSAGMHMASLMGVRCLSLWGPTHPYAGFLGYGQQIDRCVQVEHPARPNSIYGNKPCIIEGKNAMELISPGMVIERVEKVL